MTNDRKKQAADLLGRLANDQSAKFADEYNRLDMALLAKELYSDDDSYWNGYEDGRRKALEQVVASIEKMRY